MNTNRKLIGVGEKVVVLKWQNGMGEFLDAKPIVLTKDNTGVVLNGLDLGNQRFEYTVLLNNGEIFSFYTTREQLDYAHSEYLVGDKDRVPKIDTLSEVLRVNEEILERSLSNARIINRNMAFVEFI